MEVGKKAVYGLKDSRDFFEKLEWEQSALKATADQNPNEPKELYFRTFNVAITAWHLADWVWKDMTKPQRQELEKIYGKDVGANDDTGGNFIGWVKDHNRELAICREIANASKHVEVTKNPDETIDVIASARTSKSTDSEGNYITTGSGGFVVVQTWKLKVKDGNNRRDFIEIVDLVIEFWGNFISEHVI